MRMITRLLTVLAFSLLLMAGAAFGQKATISTEIKGSDGRAANNAEVRLERQDKKMAALTFRTDRNGKWSSNRLDAGTYKVTAVVAGGATSSQVVQARVNQPVMVAFDMKGAGARKKMYRWVQTTTGTHMGGHFEEVNGGAQHTGSYGSNVEEMSPEAINRIGRGTNGRGGAGGP